MFDVLNPDNRPLKDESNVTDMDLLILCILLVPGVCVGGGGVVSVCV